MITIVSMSLYSVKCTASKTVFHDVIYMNISLLLLETGITIYGHDILCDIVIYCVILYYCVILCDIVIL